jgi:hypothetical protein
MRMLLPFAALLGCQSMAGAPQTAQASAGALSDPEMQAAYAHALPKGGDLKFQELDWHNTLASAVNAARRADKPVLMWLYFGDPRGAC